MSLFRVIKYSSLLFFFGKYKQKIFRVTVVLLFALVTSLLYQDVVDYLQQQHPGSVIYALIAKIAIVYGAFAFVIWQFRPATEPRPVTAADVSDIAPEQTDRLSRLADIDSKDHLASRYRDTIERDDS
jgi:ATP/ADP translocase